MSGEKTEQATPKKLRKAREDGQVAKSVEFSGAFVTISVLVGVVVLLTTIVGQFAAFLRATIELAFSNPDPVAQLQLGASIWAYTIIPILLIGFVAALFIAYVQVGPGLSIKAVLPDGSRLNPAEGFQKMISPDRLVELVKMVVKLGLISVIAYSAFWDALPEVLRIGTVPFESAMAIFSELVFRSLGFVSGALLLIGGGDFLWQRHQFAKKMRMSKQEVKDEYKESEGDPFVKAQRKRMHQALIREAGIRNVKVADAVVVNPTHVAAAIRYDDDQHEAPIIIASGYGETAERIREQANRHEIPIVRDVALARSLAELELLEEIPESLFDAVAAVLRYVYSLQEKHER